MVDPAGRRLERHVERLGEVLAEVVAGAGLEGAVVLHQRFGGVGTERAGELLGVGLEAGEHRHRHPLLHESPVHSQHLSRLRLGLGLGGVGGVPFLPEELGGAEEEAGAHLPPDHVAPLVDEEREVAVALDPLREHRVDDRLGGRTDHQGLLEHLPPADRHHRDLRGEPFDVLRLLGEEALRDEEGEVGVLVSRGLEHPVEGLLHLLPDGIAVGTDDHAAAHRAVIGQLGLRDQLVVPGAEVGGAGGEGLLVCHVDLRER